MKKVKNIFLILICTMLVFTPCYVNANNTPEENPGENPGTTTEPETPEENPGEGEGEKEEEKDPEEKPPAEPEKTIKLDKTELSLDAGKSITLVATTTPTNATVIWSSSDETIATVDTNGKVTTKNKAGTVTITATIKDTDKKATCTVSVTRTVSKDATIKELKITNGQINPEFKSDVLEYTVTTNSDVTSLNFGKLLDNCESENKGCQITGNSKLKNGSVVKVLVTAEDGNTKKTYKFTISKEEQEVKEETSNDLKSLKINGYALNETFDTDNTQYTASIPYEIETITVTATPKDKNATVKISGITNLKVGNNTVTITVKDTDGNTKKYTIIVTREKEVSVEENETSIITSDNIETNNKTSNNSTTKPKIEGNDDNFLKYAIVSLACLILFAIGGIGIYFYLKTSPKKLKKELDSLKKEESPIVEVKEENKDSNKESINKAMQEDLIETKEFDIVKEEKEILSDEKDV